MEPKFHTPHKNKKKLTTVEQEFEHALEDFVQAIVAYEKSSYSGKLEPFEQYAERLKVHLKGSIHEFRVQFMRGYTLLCEEIEKKQK